MMLNHVTDISKAVVTPVFLPYLQEKKISLDVLRLDAIHPIISGNKWFKLKYYLQQAVTGQYKGLLTFGGAYSNHIVATAYAAAANGLQSIGIIRGEKPPNLSPTLTDAIAYGMQLHFIGRQEYQEKLIPSIPDIDAYLIVPEGGSGHTGVQGAAEILSLTFPEKYTHIACATGTGTMLAGLVRAALSHQQLIGISSLKGEDSLTNEIQQLSKESPASFKLFFNYHFGGYAKKKEPLIQFMNEWYRHTQIPLDFVYTGKLLYGIRDLVLQDYFPMGSKILVIHSGGLQGNRSLPEGMLVY